MLDPMEPVDGAPEPGALAWTTWIGALRLIVTGRTRRPALRVALIVGTMLSAVNQGSVLVNGHTTAVTWLRIVANYVIPYVVSSIGLLSAHRVRRDR